MLWYENYNHLIIKHGFRETKVYMSLILDRPAYLQLKTTFYCKECGQTVTAQTPYIEPRYTISKDVKLIMMKKLAKVNSEKDVDDTMSFIYCDSITHNIIDILPNHDSLNSKIFLRFFRKQRKKLKIFLLISIFNILHLLNHYFQTHKLSLIVSTLFKQ